MPAAADPDLALQLAKATADLYGSAVESLLEMVTRRVAQGIDQPGWADRKLVEVSRLRAEARSVVARLEAAGPTTVEEAIRDAYRLGGEAAVLEVGGAVGQSQAVDALVREMVTGLQSAHGQIVRATLDSYRTVIAEGAAPDVLTGARTRRQAAQRALNRFADRGITGFVDRSGRQWELRSYVEMATRTSVGRAHVAGALDRYQQAGHDLVIISDAPQECSVCRPFEGRVFSIGGKSLQYPPLSSALGLFHADCRHSASVYIEGLTRPLTHTADPEGDAARQEQRRLERGVRQWRQRQVVALDDSTRRQATKRVQEWDAKLARHVERHDLKRLRYREQITAAR